MPVEPPVASPAQPGGGLRAARRRCRIGRSRAARTCWSRSPASSASRPSASSTSGSSTSCAGSAIESNALVLGALTTYTEIRRSPLVAEFLPALAEAAATIGAAQIQNRGTIGGNVINASPAGDTLPLLLAADAELVAGQRPRGAQDPGREFWPGYRQTALAPDELLLRIRIPLAGAAPASGIRKVGTRRAQAISKVVMALAWQPEADGERGATCSWRSARWPPPRSARPRTEAVLEGAAPTARDGRPRRGHAGRRDPARSTTCAPPPTIGARWPRASCIG